ncbi:hypothetical protein NX774_08595 [Massilia agilis]|uniref:Uncharacterized protein n=1 Tax=Massilia agilis TaxID=1811226 RepID=A0ABT2D9Z7_9BURK|nr:hypothetical protein [Massilia agilis]MCS0807977.1 hypothetical protein [Massilia agilis]
MKSLIAAAALVAVSVPAMAQTNVSVTIGQPGFYGQINIGDAPPPALVYERPIIIQQAPRYVAQPVYLRVPPGHRKHWSRFCGRYNACGRPVYFVTDDWYERTYVPHYREVHYRPEPRVVRAPEWRDDDRGEWREEHGRGHGEGHGNGHGNGNGNGHGRGH